MCMYSFPASCIECGKAADGTKVKRTILDAQIPECEFCDGNVKPDIVFFGESLVSYDYGYGYEQLMRYDTDG